MTPISLGEMSFQAKALCNKALEERKMNEAKKKKRTIIVTIHKDLCNLHPLSGLPKIGMMHQLFVFRVFRKKKKC